MKQLKSIIYINFAQYDNTGRILDFLLENFSIVAHFSFDHLRLQNGRKYNYLTVYENGKLANKKSLLSFRTPSFFLYPSLPIVALFMFAQTFYYTTFLLSRYGKFDVFLSVNAFSTLLGIFLRSAGYTKKVIFWVWDYFPIKYPDVRLRFARWVYWQLDKPCMLLADKLVFTNSKLLDLRRKSNHLKRGKKGLIVPIGSKVQKGKKNKNKNIIVGFLGMLKYPQGLELIINNFDKISKSIPKIKLEIIGSGPEEESYRKKARKYKKNIKFYGFIEDQEKIQKIIEEWTIGLATYIPLEYNESYWGDPSKIKTYLGTGTPVITTNVSYITKEIIRYKAGIVIDYNPEKLLNAIKTIIKNRMEFSKNSLKLAEKYNYKKNYSRLFS